MISLIVGMMPKNARDHWASNLCSTKKCTFIHTYFVSWTAPLLSSEYGDYFKVRRFCKVYVVPLKDVRFIMRTVKSGFTRPPPLSGSGKVQLTVRGPLPPQHSPFLPSLTSSPIGRYRMRRALIGRSTGKGKAKVDHTSDSSPTLGGAAQTEPPVTLVPPQVNRLGRYGIRWGASQNWEQIHLR